MPNLHNRPSLGFRYPDEKVKKHNRALPACRHRSRYPEYFVKVHYPIGSYPDSKGAALMPTDYVLFNHGVNTREERPQPTYADPLFELIQRYYHQAPARTLKKIALYWGDVNNEYLDVHDILTHLVSLTDFLSEPFSQILFALLHGGEAHNSYWQNDLVAQKIAQAIESV